MIYPLTHITQIFFPRSLTQELGYTTALIPSSMLDKPQITIRASVDIGYGADNQHMSGPMPMHTPKTIVHAPSTHSSEPSQSEDSTPSYEFEDPANTLNTLHHSHSHDGHARIRRQTWEQTPDVDPEALVADGQYVFDRHARCLVRPHSDGVAIGLHPYVRFMFFFLFNWFFKDAGIRFAHSDLRLVSVPLAFCLFS
jgi:hypothetical protein